MKLLFLANRIPYPPYRGDKLKIFNLAKRLKGKHELHLVSFTETEKDKTYIPVLEKIFTKVHTVHLPKWKGAFHCLKGIGSPVPFQILYFQSGEMETLLKDILSKNEFDAIHVQHLRMAAYLAADQHLPRILDLPDAFSLYWKRRQQLAQNIFQKTFQKIEQKRLSAFEGLVIKQYPLVLVCSQEDLDYLEKTHRVNHVKLLPNGVDTTVFSPGNHDYRHDRTLLFTGNMDYAPNVDAVVFFSNEILPLIREKHPEVTFIIAGQRPVEKVKALANDFIKVTGFIEDLSVMYHQASVVVAPLRFGAGTQNKVLEAMAMGVPVVCSDIGFKGLGIENGEGVFKQTDKLKFAETVCTLLASEALRETTGLKGIKVIQKRFDWDVIALQLEKYFVSLNQG